jgi:hypothetical protein
VILTAIRGKRIPKAIVNTKKMQKEIPILFSTKMVQAILDGRKTMTRRILAKANSRYSIRWDEIDWNDVHQNASFGIKVGKKEDGTLWRIHPKWQPGDILWVRETWAPKSISEEPPGDLAHYLASDPFAAEKWKPSIHMPKAFARIWLEVTDVKVERLHDISEDDAKKEGVENISMGGFGRSGEEWKDYTGGLSLVRTARTSFKTLWVKINGSESLNQNPWVWVISFKIKDS